MPVAMPSAPISAETAVSLMQAQGQSAARPDTMSRLARAGDESRFEEAAKEFEAVFLNQMLSHMFSGIETDGPFGGGQGEEIFRSLLLNEYGKSIAQNGGLGIADNVKAHLIKLQESV